MKHQTRRTHNAHNETQRRLRKRLSYIYYVNSPRWRSKGIEYFCDSLGHYSVIKVNKVSGTNGCPPSNKVEAEIEKTIGYYKVKSGSNKEFKKITNRTIRRKGKVEGEKINNKTKRAIIRDVPPYRW